MNVLKKFGIGFIVLTLITACSGMNEKQIDFGYVDWAEGVAMVHVVQKVLEDEGYNVNLKRSDAAPLFSSLAKGDSDVFLEAWLPVTHKDYWEKYGDDLEELGDSYSTAKIGLVVPEYMDDLDSINQLNDFKDELDGKIVGIDMGAGIMKATEDAIPEYDLDFDLQTSSESSMTAALKKAIDNKDPVVVTGWKPHWMFSRFDVKMLKDPKKVYGETEEMKIVARDGFKDDHPFVAEFLENMKFDDEQIGDLMQAFEDHNDTDEAAKSWISDNQDLIDKWMPEEQESDETGMDTEMPVNEK